MCLQFRRPRFNSWVRKIPWRRKWQPTPAFLPGKSHGQRSLEGYSPWGHKRVRHDLVTKPSMGVLLEGEVEEPTFNLYFMFIWSRFGVILWGYGKAKATSWYNYWKEYLQNKCDWFSKAYWLVTISDVPKEGNWDWEQNYLIEVWSSTTGAIARKHYNFAAPSIEISVDGVSAFPKSFPTMTWLIPVPWRPWFGWLEGSLQGIF